MIDLFCIASGPSLTVEDCNLVFRTGARVLAVNNSWQMAPSCDYLYAGDHKWWDVHHKKITIDPGRWWTCSEKAAVLFGVNYHRAGGPYNSGMRAIQFGISQGFKAIGLLGYDCSLKEGLHWHGPHTEPGLKNPSTDKMKRWFIQFERVAKQAEKAGVKIYNCSRKTELTFFPVISLEDAVEPTYLSASIASARLRGCDMGGHWM